MPENIKVIFESIVAVAFQNALRLKYIKIIFFYFLKNIFNINT